MKSKASAAALDEHGDADGGGDRGTADGNYTIFHEAQSVMMRPGGAPARRPWSPRQLDLLGDAGVGVEPVEDGKTGGELELYHLVGAEPVERKLSRRPAANTSTTLRGALDRNTGSLASDRKSIGLSQGALADY